VLVIYKSKRSNKGVTPWVSQISKKTGLTLRGTGKKARDDIEAGTFTLMGELPVNTDGGLELRMFWSPSWRQRLEDAI